MSIRSRIDDAIMLRNAGRFEGAFLSVLVAVAATARRECKDRQMTDADCFKVFLSKSVAGRLSAEFRGECHSVCHIFYKWLRCELVHEGGIPVDIEFLDRPGCWIRAGGAPSFKLQLSYDWFDELFRLVTTAPTNAGEFSK